MERELSSTEVMVLASFWRTQAQRRFPPGFDQTFASIDSAVTTFIAKVQMMAEHSDLMANLIDTRRLPR